MTVLVLVLAGTLPEGSLAWADNPKALQKQRQPTPVQPVPRVIFNAQLPASVPEFQSFTLRVFLNGKATDKPFRFHVRFEQILPLFHLTTLDTIAAVPKDKDNVKFTFTPGLPSGNYLVTLSPTADGQGFVLLLQVTDSSQPQAVMAPSSVVSAQSLVYVPVTHSCSLYADNATIDPSTGVPVPNFPLTGRFLATAIPASVGGFPSANVHVHPGDPFVPQAYLKMSIVGPPSPGQDDGKFKISLYLLDNANQPAQTPVFTVDRSLSGTYDDDVFSLPPVFATSDGEQHPSGQNGLAAGRYQIRIERPDNNEPPLSYDVLTVD